MKFDDFVSNEDIAKEYKKTFLLNMFRKLCVRMNRDEKYKAKIRVLYRESYDNTETTKIIIEKEFKYEMSDEEASLMNTWISANLRKKDRRKPIPQDIKIQLYKKQNGKCLACGEDLGTDYSKIHVDHIIPWMLVGDELQDNYQDLCETCNECKSAQTDYIFRSMLKLV